MKPRIRIKGGYVHIDACELTNSLYWLTQYGDEFYFHLNIYTRALFKRDILPHKNEFDVDPTVLNTIRTINLTHERDPIATLISPSGITLKDYQVKAINLMLSHDRYCLFLGPGTGKTLVAIGYILSTQHTRDTNHIVVVTPKRVIDQYMGECKKYLPAEWLVTNSTKEACCNKTTILVTNYEQLANVLAENPHINTLILDESHKAQSYSSNTNKILRQLSAYCDEIYEFSGTPEDKSRSEIMYQLAILDQRFVPSKTKFLNRYFVLDEYYSPEKEKKEFSIELDYMIKGIAFGAESDELVKLPDTHDHDILCDKPEFYDTLLNDHILEFPDKTIVCDTPGKLRSKLKQLCNGFLYDNDGKMYRRINSPKVNELQAVIDTLPHGIIYTQFDEDAVIASEVCESLGKKYVVVYGKIKDKIATERINSFKNGEVPFLIIQAGSGGTGLDILSTNNNIFYGLPESYRKFHQCKYRTRRLTQTKECNYYYIMCANTIDTKIQRALKKKKSFVAKTYAALK